ncbi:response regulator [Mucilaginibacter boryungensis]|uniref:histidine kinase n=1 Tax=Mucilaginibacter boryungensis TaxID=768480 RepID=A0ABR9XGU7_9SPHI|nr:response regulator [Mucilaginibacter boryungensis]MBE9666612.1 response regulator [Mucilaginibacter boryungensis]
MLKFSFRNQVLLGFIISLILVFGVFYFSYNSIDQLKDDQSRVSHTEAVIQTANKVQLLLLDGETGQRGYIATSRENFLDPYTKSIFQVSDAIQTLANMVNDSPAQKANVDSLNKYALLKKSELAAIIDDARSKSFDDARTRMQDGRGKVYMDKARYFVGKIVNEETRLLNIRKASTDSAAKQAISAIFAGGLIVICVVLLLFFYIQKTFAQQKKAEEEIRVTNIELEKVLAENEAKNWLLTGTGLLNERMQGQQSEKELSQSVLSEICKYTNAISGTLYLFDEPTESLDLYAYYAFHDLGLIKKKIKLSEGWLGQVAKDQKATVIKGTLNDKLELETSIISQELVEIMIVPFFFDKKLKGVIEVAYQNQISTNIHDYIIATANDVGIAINTAQARTIMHDLFEETQQQAEELEAQQEEMRVTNEELLNKTEMLQASEEELRVQQEELRTINAELEEKASLLEEKNQAIEEARASINLKVQELEATGKYKSEFLANMSHELRTPLNSILVLARILKDNKGDNLSEDQIKYASVIFNAGNDLLTLINDILDLSKIESGKLEMMNDQVEVKGILHDMELLFAEVAANKKITFKSTITKDIPDRIYTDKMRVEQVIKNMLSNAFKFTPENGSIFINVTPGEAPKTISFTIKDTGIGIHPEKQRLIFEAFQQADGSTSRKYGGTGLGLSISRELANLLGGRISVKSEQGKGSEFTLTIPFEAAENLNQEDFVQTAETFKPVKEFLKPADQIARKDPKKEALVVIVEDDKNFADILKDYARDHGYKAIVINEGTHAFETIKESQPDAVILDIMLPGKDGWQILKELKNSPETAGVPVHLMSAGEAAANRVRKEGAISFMKKPIDTATLDKLFNEMVTQSGVAFKQILLVEDHEAQSEALREMMEKQGIAVDQAFDGASAFDMLQQNDYQCVILDLNLPDISGLDLLDKIKGIEKFSSLPVIVNTAMELDKTSVNRLMQYANAMVVKTSKSSDRLIDEVNLFLHKIRTSSSTPASGAKTNPVSKGKEMLKGKKVLVVDDDMRNIFALTSALQTYDLQVEIANDGEEAIAKLEKIGDIDIVLMDIMMPKMDGYEATRHIRKQNKWAKLPVIALTAKAMRDDREKCIAAGASDYITKPVDIDRLISLMQLWLEK